MKTEVKIPLTSSLFHARNISGNSPKAILSAIGFFRDVCRIPRRLNMVSEFPEVDKEVGDLASWRQKACQVGLVVTGQPKAPR